MATTGRAPGSGMEGKPLSLGLRVDGVYKMHQRLVDGNPAALVKQ